MPPLRRYVSVPGAAYDLHCAYLGEPAPREAECESEQADALCLHRCAATASASLSMRGVRPVGVCVGFDAGLYRWRWLQLLQWLDPPLPPPVEAQPYTSLSPELSLVHGRCPLHIDVAVLNADVER